MSQTPNDGIEEAPRSSAPRRGVSGASLVWLVPIAALLVAVFVALNAWNSRGPVIQIAFEDAAGILPDETELRYRNVPVGVVENVAFNEDLTRVLVDVRLDKEVASFVDGRAEFWIVQPEVTLTEVSGLQTVLSGVYIEGIWDRVAEEPVYEFMGLNQAPLVTTFNRGTIIELRSNRPQGLTENTPILFKGIEVGRLGPARISRDGRSVFAPAIIYEPHDRLVSTATRFWDVSGFSVSIGPSGAEIDFSSVASLISGGITFDTLVSGGRPLTGGLVFDVFPDQASARNSIFEDNDGSIVTVTMIFNENVSGLATDAIVEWRGVRIGKVVNVSGLVDEDQFGDSRVRLLTTVEISPSRFGLSGPLSETEALEFLAERIDEGLRARLATASILTGGLKIELITVLGAEPGELDRAAEPFPIFPVTDSDIADVSATAEGVFERVNALPVEELLQSAISFLDNATALVASPALRETPDEILGLLTDARGVISSDEIQALPEDLAEILGDVQSASADLRAILAEVREASAVDRILTAVDQAGAAAEAANVALQGIPELTQRISAFVESANELPLDGLVDQATGLAAEARAFAASEALRALPASAQTALDDLSSVLTSVSEADTAGNLNLALTEAAEAADALEQSVSGVPDVVARLDRIAANAEEVRLDTLAEELEGILATASQLFADASQAELPTALAGALNEAQAALAELRAGGLIESANQTMSSAQEAASAVELAASELPTLTARLNATLAQAEETLSSFDQNSTFARETSAALREIERAAKAMTDLARAIERRPNSLLIGR